MPPPFPSLFSLKANRHEWALEIMTSVLCRCRCSPVLSQTQQPQWCESLRAEVLEMVAFCWTTRTDDDSMVPYCVMVSGGCGQGRPHTSYTQCAPRRVALFSFPFDRGQSFCSVRSALFSSIRGKTSKGTGTIEHSRHHWRGGRSSSVLGLPVARVVDERGEWCCHAKPRPRPRPSLLLFLAQSDGGGVAKTLQCGRSL